MSHILIIGKDYKDCKAKRDSFDVENKNIYVLVTKIKHLSPHLDYNEVITTDLAEENPEYLRIMKSIKRGIVLDGGTDKINQLDVELPVVEEEIVPPAIPVVEDEVEEEITLPEATPIDVPEPISSEEFEEMMPNLIEQEEESGEIMLIDNDDEKITESLDDEEAEVEIKEQDAENTVEDNDTPEESPLVSEEEELEPLEIPKEVELTPTVIDVEIDPLPEEEIIEEDILPDIKPVNKPRGWHSRLEFIDDVGNIFHKGKYVGKLDSNE